MIRIRKEVEFARSEERVVLPGPNEEGRPFVEMDRFSRLQSLASDAGRDPEAPARKSPARGPDPGSDPNRVRLGRHCAAFFDRTRIREALLARKRSRDWRNPVIEAETVDALLESDDWYCLRLPSEQLAVGGFDSLRRFEDLAVELLTEYADRYWRRRRLAWEHRFYETAPLREGDPNHIREYRLWTDGRDRQLVRDVRELARSGASIPKLSLLSPEIHAWRPLVGVEEGCPVRVAPVPLDGNETALVRKLAALARRRELLRGRELFLIRNLTRGRGVSFFDEFAYYPDFILWLKDASVQQIVFLDPKGLGRYGQKERRKVELCRRIEDIEAVVRKTDPELRLHAHVLSVTRPDRIDDGRRTREQWESDGVYFLYEEGSVERMIERLVAGCGESPSRAEAARSAAGEGPPSPRERAERIAQAIRAATGGESAPHPPGRRGSPSLRGRIPVRGALSTGC